MKLTFYPSLYDIDTHNTQDIQWSDIPSHFHHVSHIRKDQAPGFGPYELTPPSVTCVKHRDGKARPGPHRCDDCVTEVSCLVFDADSAKGPDGKYRPATTDDILRCEEVLAKQNFARLWYSTRSFSPPDHASFRLLLPLLRPVSVASLSSVRAWCHSMFKIPFNTKQCGSASHFYYLPDHPAARSGLPSPVPPVLQFSEGIFFDPSRFVYIAPTKPSFRPQVVRALEDWSPLHRPCTPERLAHLRAQLTALLKETPARFTQRVSILSKILSGQPLADHGERNSTTLRASGILAHALPDASLEELSAIITPSIEAMVSLGSKLTDYRVERMLESGMRNKAEYDASTEAARIRIAAKLGLTRAVPA